MASRGQALGRWQQVLIGALAEHKAVGVRAVVVSHLGREATRAEIQSARRAAHLLERRGQVKLLQVAVPAGLDKSGGSFLVATRSEMGLLEWPDEAALRAIATEGPPLIDESTEALNTIVAALQAAAAKADDMQLDAVNEVYVDQLVPVMATSLRKLNRLLSRVVEGQHRSAG
jgi:hypothetical protein